MSAPDRTRRIQNRLFGPKWLNRWQSRLAEHAAGTLRSIPGASTALTRLVINYYAEATPPRPQPFSLQNDEYTSWSSLTDRSFSSRHLQAEHTERTSPAAHDVNELFRRTTFQEADDTSVAFAFFAQWFTDSFLRTDRNYPRKNSSNHCIDLCQIYGLTAAKTDLLREHSGGRLKSQQTPTGEFPPFLLEPGTSTIKAEFAGLYSAQEEAEIRTICRDENEPYLFAVGLERGNATIGHATFTTLFLREHNRIARLLEQTYGWTDDDRLFETARNIVIVLLLKLVIEEYVMHIGAWDIPLTIPHFVADKAHWNRQNWISIEFNLLYRWHSLVPDTIERSTGAPLHLNELISDNKLVMDTGIDSLLGDWSRQRAGKIALWNAPDFFFEGPPGMPRIVPDTTTLMRSVKLQSYNNYRTEFGLLPLKNYDELTRDAALRQKLIDLYGEDIDDLEWYVGLFAEDYPRDYMMGELMMVMVAHDAFTQALTNPLLAEEVYTEATFTRLGLDIIEKETTMEPGNGILQKILARNSMPRPVHASFKC